MVSLSRSFNTNSGGATFFSESVNAEDQERLQPILDTYGIFKPLKTVPIFSVHTLLFFILECMAIAYAVQHPDEKSRCKEYFTLIYVHILLWFVTLVSNLFVKHFHHQVRLNGYLDFYKKTKLHVSLPLYIVSLWSVTLMFVQALIQQFYPDDFAERCIHGGTLSPVSYLCAVIGVEFCVLAGINIHYGKNVLAFNKLKPLPDVQREEWMACASPESMGENEIGYRQLGDKVYDLLEKQADLIRYLKEHNERLGEKLMLLSAQLQQARSHRDVS